MQICNLGHPGSLTIGFDSSKKSSGRGMRKLFNWQIENTVAKKFCFVQCLAKPTWQTSNFLRSVEILKRQIHLGCEALSMSSRGYFWSSHVLECHEYRSGVHCRYCPGLCNINAVLLETSG